MAVLMKANIREACLNGLRQLMLENPWRDDVTQEQLSAVKLPSYVESSAQPLDLLVDVYLSKPRNTEKNLEDVCMEVNFLVSNYLSKMEGISDDENLRETISAYFEVSRRERKDIGNFNGLVEFVCRIIQSMGHQIIDIANDQTRPEGRISNGL
jgi:hypothetical protein